HDNYVGVNFGGGLNTMLYKPANGQQKVGMGFDAGIHYARFFNQWAGLGVGLQYSWANAYATYNWNEVTPGLTHPSNPNTPYTLTAGFSNFVERQNIGVLSIPVEALFRKAFNDRVALIGGVGLSLDLPIHGSYIAKGGSYSTTGVFPAIGSYVISDMPEHGFSTYTTTQNAKFNNRAKVGGSLIADLGARFALDDNWGLYVGVSFGYGFTNLLGAAKTEEMIMINSANSAVIDYRGTFDSNETAKANLLRCGLKIAVDFGWPNTKKQAEAERLAREEAERLAAEQAAAERAEAERIAKEEAEQRAKAEAERKAQAEAEAKAKAEAEKAKAEAEAMAQADAAAQAHAARMAHVNSLKEKGESVTVHFETGADELQFKPGEQEIVDEICEAMVEEPSLRIIIAGHTDNSGDPEKNLRYFGKKRAESLKAYMVSKGVSADQIKCESKGDKEPVADNNTREGRALNRRANIRFE
ncbi:MAG: OmpA family protein, partial [Paludibacteraceae bacterium]|nr:OmpA family protein [Paludibacteraceae bacterium]